MLYYPERGWKHIITAAKNIVNKSRNALLPRKGMETALGHNRYSPKSCRNALLPRKGMETLYLPSPK